MRGVRCARLHEAPSVGPCGTGRVDPYEIRHTGLDGQRPPVPYPALRTAPRTDRRTAHEHTRRAGRHPVPLTGRCLARTLPGAGTDPEESPTAGRAVRPVAAEPGRGLFHRVPASFMPPVSWARPPTRAAVRMMASVTASGSSKGRT